jgi:hypothetical protein
MGRYLKDIRAKAMKAKKGSKRKGKHSTVRMSVGGTQDVKRRHERSASQQPSPAPLVPGYRGATAKAKSKKGAHKKPSKRDVSRVLQQPGTNLPLSVLGTTH